jgi:hypothetical protein
MLLLGETVDCLKPSLKIGLVKVARGRCLNGDFYGWQELEQSADLYSTNQVEILVKSCSAYLSYPAKIVAVQ